MTAYQIYSVGRDGRSVALATADTATLALARLRDAFNEHPRAWATDHSDEDVGVEELMRRAEEEAKNA